MERLLLKLFNAFTHIRHTSVEKRYRYYISDNYYSRLYQYKYFLRDYVFRKKYKIIDYQGEFQQELCFVLPFAYWHYLNGTLKTTKSSKNTKELYFFSPDHKEIYERRVWEYNRRNFEFPNMTHCLSLSRKKWAQLPLKKQYQNKEFKFEKPVLIVANKYNIEWNKQPLNFLDISALESIIEKCKDKYQIIYNRASKNLIVADNSEILDLNEFAWLREKYPEVLILEDLYLQHQNRVNNFNHMQLLVYANCEHFISVHGGTAALCSYFGGVNIIFSKSGIEHVFNEFSTIFTTLSSARILHATTTNQILSFLNEF